LYSIITNQIAIKEDRQRRADSCLGKFSLICPSGSLANSVSSPSCKNILLFRNRKSVYIHRRLVPQQGRFAIVTNAGRDAVDAAASGVRWDRRADCSP
jgi:hypothetical protein